MFEFSRRFIGVRIVRSLDEELSSGVISELACPAHIVGRIRS